MFAEFDDSAFKSQLATLKTSLLIGTAANVMLMLLTSSMFEETTGFCDESATGSRQSFQFVLLFTVLINTPSFIYYHTTDKACEAEKDLSSDEGVKLSFAVFAVAFGLKLYTTMTIFLSGPFPDSVFFSLLFLFVLLSFGSYTSLVRFGNRYIVQ